MLILNTEGRYTLRSDSAYNWNKYNPILAENELVIEIDSVGISFKLGDGITEFKNLSYCAGVKSCPYQIGDIYTTLSSVKPQDRWKGTVWEELPAGRVLIAQGEYIEDKTVFDFTAGYVGGEAMVQLTSEEMAKHTHTRGTMNITGTGTRFNSEIWTPTNTADHNDGAILKGTSYGECSLTGTNEDNRASSYGWNFDASLGWTGETSEVGNDKPHNNLQPYLCVYIYKRIA